MPRGASQGATRALALAAGAGAGGAGGAGGAAYVEALLRAVGRPGPADARTIGLLVERHQAAARDLLPSDPDAPMPLEALAHCWSALWDDVRGAVRPEVWERLQALH